jgi:hypothetical protein
LVIGLTLLAIVTVASARPAVAADAQKQIVFLHDGKMSHGYGGHAYGAGFRMLARLLNENVSAVHAVVLAQDQDLAPLDTAAAIVLGNDYAPLMQKLGDRIELRMKQGVGFACLHCTLLPIDPKSRQRMLGWVGGLYERNWSVNPTWEAEFKSFPGHPVARGLQPFRIADEWYYHMRFVEEMKGITPILAALPPESTRQGHAHLRARAGRAEVLAWVYERPGGGRGFGFTGMHTHWNWAQDSFRKTVLNALVWIAGAEVPPGGVASKTPTLEELESYLGQSRPAKFNVEALRRRLPTASPVGRLDADPRGAEK